MSDLNSGTGRVPVLTHAFRVVSYLIASVAGLLCVATVSGRLLVVEQPWHFFAVGSTIAVLSAFVGPMMDRLPEGIRSLKFLPFLLLALIAALVSALFGMALAGVTVSPMGVLSIAIVCSAFSALVYLVAEAGEANDAA